jgi:hypothetical protein
MKRLFAACLLASVWSMPGYAWTHDDLGKQSLNMDFSDAREHSGALTFQTPKGWDTNGQWIGAHPDDRFVVKITAPDHHARIQLADGNIVMNFVPPNRQLQAGQTVTVGGIRITGSNYVNGMQFAQGYARNMYGSPDACARFEVTDAVPDERPANMYVAPNANIQGGSSGLAFFTCEKQDGDVLDGVVHATTVQMVLPDGQPLWYVGWLWHYLAAPSQARATFLVARYVTDSIRIDPQWVATHYAPPPPPPQAGGGVGPGIIRNPDGTYRPDVAGANAAMAAQQNRFHGMMDRQQQQQESFSNTLNGVAPTVDPTTGQQMLRPYTSGDTHCANGLGQYTDSYASNCGLGYHRLQNQ